MNIGMLVGVVVALAVVVPSIEVIDFASVQHEYATAAWPWIVAAAVLYPLILTSEATALLGAVNANPPLIPTVLMRLSTKFLGVITPDGIGGPALQVRYFNLVGVAVASATSAVVLSSTLGSLMQLVVLIPSAAVSSTSIDSSGVGGTTVLIVIPVVAAAIGLVLLVPRLRGKVVPVAKRAVTDLWAVIRDRDGRATHDGRSAVVRRERSVASSPVQTRRPASRSALVRILGRAVLGAAVLGVGSLGAAPAPAPAAVADDGAEGWVVDRVRFEPVDPGGGVLTVEGLGAYRGAIEIVPADGGLAVINDVGVEDYVKGISEVPSSWPPEALRAQAIAARTYGLNQKTSTADSPWKARGADICNTDSCQVYSGLAKEQGPDGANWVAAVDDTAGQVLLYRGRPLFAQYSASNGGRSTAGSQPYLRSIDDPDDARSFFGRWEWGLPLGALAPIVDVAPPFVLTGVTRQGGVVVFGVAGPDQFSGEVEIGAEELRSRINAAVSPPDGLPMPLPASDYAVEGSGESAAFSGGGWGHGVGMSQYGALGKAQRGWDAGDILAAYYGGIRPDTLGADQLPASIRVELAAGRGSVAVSPERYFRVVAGSGPPAEGIPSGGIEVGLWNLQPADGGVRVIPPAGRAEPLALRTATVEPPGAEGQPPAVRYGLSAPAVVTVRYVTPTGLPGALPPRLVDVGEVVDPLPPPGAGGEYQVVIEADGGPGRFVSAPLRFHVTGDARIHIGTLGSERQAGGRPDRTPWLGVAALLILTTGLACRRTARRLRS